MKEKILKVMSSTFNVDNSILNEDTSKNNLSEWDSMTHLNLIVNIENEFNLIFDNEEIISIIDFKSLEEIIKRKSN